MHAIHITPIRPDFLSKVRQRGVDDLGQPVERLTAQGGEPCRDALRRARAGEALILASYCPFSIAGPYREYGPVFVLAEQDEQAVPPAALPVSGARPYLGASFVLRAYCDQERIVDAVITTPLEAQTQLDRLFTNPGARFVLVRFAAYGCYALRIERP